MALFPLRLFGGLGEMQVDPYQASILCGLFLLHSVERLNEHSLEDCLGRQRTIAIYILDGWDAGIVLVSTHSL
jgi:hypothetical protein